MNETIINGIDVSECEFFEKQHIEDMYESDDCNVCIDNFCALCWKECEKHDGCYFKQLKRLQEENIRLKKIKDDFFKQAEISHQAVQDKNKIIEKLETAIQEIKNLAELEVMLDKNSKAFYPANIQRILDEINEALNDRD